jgi:large subunit ribosomal protein L18e
VAVPGKVLASGSLSHPVTVAAFSFSEGAREKITLAEGRVMSLTTLLEEGIEPSTIRILK